MFWTRADYLWPAFAQKERNAAGIHGFGVLDLRTPLRIDFEGCPVDRAKMRREVRTVDLLSSLGMLCSKITSDIGERIRIPSRCLQKLDTRTPRKKAR